VHGRALLTFNLAGSDSALIFGSSLTAPGLTVSPISDPSVHDIPTVTARAVGDPSVILWASRDLRLAGEVTVKVGDEICTKLFDSETAIATIPAGLFGGFAPSWMNELQQRAAAGMPAVVARPLASLIASAYDIPQSAVLDYELSLVDAESARVVGADGSLVAGGGLDWLAGTFAAIRGFLRTATPRDGVANVLIIADDFRAHWISDALARVVGAEKLPQLFAKSLFVNVQALDARPPGRRDSPKSIGVGQGVAGIADLSGGANNVVARFAVRHAADKIGVNVRVVAQKKVGTVGGIAYATFGVQAVDVAVPMLGRGSPKLTAAIADVEAAVRLLAELSENFEEHRLLL
jgi:aspartyl aminopeptidase